MLSQLSVPGGSLGSQVPSNGPTLSQETAGAPRRRLIDERSHQCSREWWTVDAESEQPQSGQTVLDDPERDWEPGPPGYRQREGENRPDKTAPHVPARGVRAAIRVS